MYEILEGHICLFSHQNALKWFEVLHKAVYCQYEVEHKETYLLVSLSYQCDLMWWLELLLLGETSDVRWQWWHHTSLWCHWRCYSQLVFQVWVSQSWVSFENKNWKSLAVSFNAILCHVSNLIWDGSPRQTDTLVRLHFFLARAAPQWQWEWPWIFLFFKCTVIIWLSWYNKGCFLMIMN